MPCNVTHCGAHLASGDSAPPARSMMSSRISACVHSVGSPICAPTASTPCSSPAVELPSCAAMLLLGRRAARDSPGASLLRTQRTLCQSPSQSLCQSLCRVALHLGLMRESETLHPGLEHRAHPANRVRRLACSPAPAAPA